MSQDAWKIDLSAPLTREEQRALKQRPKKDHKCPHDGKHLTGMELCEQCGDFGVCEQCGMDYIKRDMSGLPMCHLCWSVKLLEDRLARERHEQRERIAKYRPAQVEPQRQEAANATQAGDAD